MRERCDVAIIGAGFAGSLLSRVLARLGLHVVLVERGVHPRFAVGESTTPLANLALERIARRYRCPDLHRLAAHGRWLESYPTLGRGLKRGFTFYRHQANLPFANDQRNSSRLLVAASPTDAIADTHWLRADVDAHFVREAIAAGVEYRDRTELTQAKRARPGFHLRGRRDGRTNDLLAGTVIDASGPGGFLARELGIDSRLDRTATRSALVFGHFREVKLFADVASAELAAGPFPDDWAAVHHLIDEGWMYSLRFDHGVVSAGFLLSPRGVASLDAAAAPRDPEALWRFLIGRYPSIGRQFEGAVPIVPIRFHASIQHRLARAAGPGWLMLPHTYAFVDPLFSTGIAWSLRAIERIARCFEAATGGPGDRTPCAELTRRYDEMLAREADQIDHLVAGAYDAMVSFDLFTAQAMLYFAAVSFAEVGERIRDTDDRPWDGFLGVGDPVLDGLPREARHRLARITGGGSVAGDADARRGFTDWMAAAIGPRNLAGLADPARRNLYPVDLDILLERADVLGLSREALVAVLPRLRGVIGGEEPVAAVER